MAWRSKEHATDPGSVGDRVGQGEAAELPEYADIKEELRGALGERSAAQDVIIVSLPWGFIPEDFVTLIAITRTGREHVVNYLHTGIAVTPRLRAESMAPNAARSCRFASVSWERHCAQAESRYRRTKAYEIEDKA